MAGMDQLDSYVELVIQTAENCGVSAVAVHYGRRHFLRGAKDDSHGPCNHRDSPVARGYGGRCPHAGRTDFPCRGEEACSRSPDCSSDHEIPKLLDMVIDVLVVVVVLDIPVVMHRPIPMVSLTMEIPQLLFDEVVVSVV